MNYSRFMIIDDDPLHLKLCSYIIKKAVGDHEIKTFEFPLEALRFITESFNNEKNPLTTVLYLDINMPVLNGWEFLDEFEKLDPNIHKQFTINILSSSIDPSDKRKAESNPFVKKFISKPLKVEEVKEEIS